MWVIHQSHCSGVVEAPGHAGTNSPRAVTIVAVALEIPHPDLRDKKARQSQGKHHS